MFWVGVLHLMLPVGMLLYAIIAPSSWDKYAFLYLSLITIHWVLCQGECMISYYYKKRVNPNYQLGDNTELQDIQDVLKSAEHKYRLPFSTSRTILDIVTFGAVIAWISRFFWLQSIKPLWALGIYVMTTFVWFVLLKAGIQWKTYNWTYVVCAIFLIIKVLSS